MSRARLALEGAAGLCVVLGVLAYVLIDPYGTLGDPPGCDDDTSCRTPWWNDGGAVQGLLVLVGIGGVVVLVVSLVSRRLPRRGAR